MKKIYLAILLLISLLFMSVMTTSTSALWVDSYFQDGSKIAVIDHGDDINYFVDVTPNSYAKSLNIYVRLFNDKYEFVEEVAVLEDIDLNSNDIYFSPLLNIPSSVYGVAGDFFLDVKVTQIATNDDVQIQSKRIDFKVKDDGVVGSLVANFTYSPASPFVGDVVTFTSNSYSVGGEITSEEWFVDNVKIDEGTIITHIFNESKTYQVRLVVRDDAGRTDEITRPVVVQIKPADNIAPVANFLYNPQNVLINDIISFESTSYDVDGYIVDEEWFIDGDLVHQGNNETSFIYTFTEPGTYTVRLTVEDDDGATDSITRNIVVSPITPPNVPPVANFTYSPSSPFAGDVITFESTSYDVDGVIVDEQWFIDDSLIHQGTNETTFTHVFTEPGTYIVMLIVEDDDGATDSITRSVVVKEKVVENIPPVARFVYDPLNPYVDTVVLFTSTSYDVDGYIVDEEWFIDNVSVHQGVNETSFNHAFSNAGIYYVRLTVEDDDGATNSVTKSILIKEKPVVNVPPVADFTYSPSSPKVGDVVSFESTSYDVDGVIVDEEWFIDGVLVHQGTNETTFNHVFNQPGTYAVRLTVEDDDGATDSITKNVVVTKKDEPDYCADADVVFDVDLSVVSDYHYTKKTSDSTTLNIAVAGNHSVLGVAHRGASSQCQSGEAFYLEINGVVGPIAPDDSNPCAITTRLDDLGDFPFTQGSNEIIMHSTNDTSSSNSVELTKICIYYGDEPVENVPPVADFTYSPTSPRVGDVVTFESTSYDVDGVIVDEEWFIDGVLVHQGTNETTFNHVFNQVGTYAVRLTVEDDDGATDSITKNIVVKEKLVDNIAPVADFIYSPTSPKVGDVVSFESTSYDVDGYIVDEKWFIDNSLIHQGVNETSFTYTFNQDGTFAVRLIVEDDDGATAQITKNVYVSKVSEDRLVAIIKGPQSPFINEDVVYDGSSSYDTSGADIVEYEWILRQNNQIIHQSASSSPYLDYTFQNKGQYHLTLIVTNEFGTQANASMNIYVSRRYSDDDLDFGDVLTVDYHSVIGTSYGVVKTNDEFIVSVTVTNRGDKRLSNLRTTFALPEFGISEKSNSFNLDAGRTRTIDFYMVISDYDYVPVGNHDALLGVAGDGVIKYKYFPMTLK